MNRGILSSIAVFSLLGGLSLGAPLKVQGLKTEHEVNPVGMSAKPRLSWHLESNERLKRQSGYHILAASSSEKLAANEGDLWDSKQVRGTQRLFRPWGGSELKNGQTVHWKVKVWDEKKKEGPWSAPAQFTVGGEKKLSPIIRRSSFESNVKELNDLYTESVKTMEEELKKFAAGDATALGSGGKVQRSAREYLYHFNADAALLQWLEKLEASRDRLGHYPSIPGGKKNNPVDSSAGAILPQTLWWMTGDDTIGKSRWPIIEKYLMAREKVDYGFEGGKFGEAIKSADGTPSNYLDLCMMGLSTRMMRELSRPAEEPLNVIRYKDYAARIRNSFAKQYIEKDGNLKVKTQTAQLLALRCGVLKPEQQAFIVKKLVESVKKNGPQVSEFGAGMLLPVLYITGHYDEALSVVTKQMTPEVKKVLLGNGLTEYFMASLGGISSTLPGFQQVLIAPHIPESDKLQWVKSSYQSPVGPISIHWEKSADKSLSIKCTVPAGVYAQAKFPAAKGATITESGKTLKGALGVEEAGRDDKSVKLVLQSGSYHFLIR